LLNSETKETNNRHTGDLTVHLRLFFCLVAYTHNETPLFMEYIGGGHTNMLTFTNVHACVHTHTYILIK